MYGYIYLTTNVENNRKYIGKHKSETFDTDYFGSGKILLQSLYKITPEGKRVKQTNKFTCEVLHWCKSKEELNYYEAYYINKFDAVNSPEYYNLTKGGTGDSVSGLIYITNGTVNKKINPEELADYEAQGFYRGGPKPSQEVIEQRRLSNIGKKRTKETCDRISKANTGKKASEETRQKQSQAKLGKPTSRKGKICVTKDDEHFEYILKEELNEYLAKGFMKKGPSHKDPEKSKENYRKARQNKVIVNDGITYYYIDKDKLEEYLSNGYSLNKPKKK